MELNAAARAAFDAMSEGITIIDTDGIIVFGNRAYRNFLNKEAGGDIGPIEGYRLRDLRPGARLPDVLEKGKPILHQTRQEIQDFYFVNMYPIYGGKGSSAASRWSPSWRTPTRPRRSWRPRRPGASRCSAASTRLTAPGTPSMTLWPSARRPCG
nr:PAS domain-containing protein [Intestinimonas timonensis]